MTNLDIYNIKVRAVVEKLERENAELREQLAITEPWIKLTQENQKLREEVELLKAERSNPSVVEPVREPIEPVEPPIG